MLESLKRLSPESDRRFWRGHADTGEDVRDCFYVGPAAATERRVLRVEPGFVGVRDREESRWSLREESSFFPV